MYPAASTLDIRNRLAFIQAMLMLPAGAQWEGLRLKAELEVKGVRHPVRWAGRQKVNSDGSFTLRHNYNP